MIVFEIQKNGTWSNRYQRIFGVEDGSQEAVLIDAPPDSKSEVENSLKTTLFSGDMAYPWSLGSYGRCKRFSGGTHAGTRARR